MKVKRFSNNIEATENSPGKVLDAVSGAHSAAALGSLGYGAVKLGKVGKSVYEGTKEEESKIGKLLKAKKHAEKILKKSGRSFKSLNTSSKLMDELEGKAKENIGEKKEGLEKLKDTAKKMADKDGTIDSEVYNKIKGKADQLKEGIKKQKGVIKGLQREKGIIKDAKNLKKAGIAAGVALTTGAISAGTKAISKNQKKKELQKKFSLESGEPNQKGSLGRELKAKAKVGAIKGSITGGSLGLTVGSTLGMALRDLKLTGLVSLAGLGIGTLVGILSKMSESIGAEGRKNRVQGVGMNEVLDFLEDSITAENNQGYGIRGRNLVSRYLSLDGDPKNFDLSIALKDGIGIMSVKKGVAGNVESELESMVENNRLADYKSKSLKDGYLVQLFVPSVKALANFIYNLAYRHHIRINIITQKL
jgi:hypothetical protein